MTELHNPLCGKRSQEKCYISVCTSKKNTIYPHRYMYVFLNILSIAITWNNRADYFSQRSCRVESTRSRPITKVKQHWARLVLRWVTAWELRVVLALFTFVNTWPTEPSDLPPPCEEHRWVTERGEVSLFNFSKAYFLFCCCCYS